MALSSWKRLHPHFPLLLALLPSTPQSGKGKSDTEFKTKGYQVHGILEKAKLDTVKRSMVVRSWGEEWMNGWNTEDFSGSEATFVVVQSLSHIPFFVTPWIVTRQAPLSSTIS